MVDYLEIKQLTDYDPCVALSDFEQHVIAIQEGGTSDAPARKITLGGLAYLLKTINDRNP